MAQAAAARPSPDGAVGVDLRLHLLPPRQAAVVAHLPEGVVLDGSALLELGARPALVKLVALWGCGMERQQEATVVSLRAGHTQTHSPLGSLG